MTPVDTVAGLPPVSAAAYREVRAQTERLVAHLAAEDLMVQSMTEASPAKWHLAHTTWFFETFILHPHAPAYSRFDPRFTFLFNSYYKQLDGHPNRAIRGSFSRPTLDEVRRYRAHVDGAMQEYLESKLGEDIVDLLQLGLNHEQQHQELIVTDLKHAFWTNPLRPAYMDSLEAAAPAPPLAWREFGEGVYQVGHDGPGFAFDNESPRHQVYLQPFRLASRAVTNAEYLEFMADGGYRNPSLWLSDAWDQLATAGWQAPLYWEQGEGGWCTFTCAGMRSLDPNEPVCHVSYYEADAFAR